MVFFAAWLLVAACLVIIAAVSHRLIIALPIPAAVITAIFSLLELNPLLGVAIFFLLSAVTYIIFRAVISAKSNASHGIESAVGEKCIVVERIDNLAGSGEVKVNGQVWSARSAYDDESFDVGESLFVVAIEGVKLVCRSKNNI